MRESSVLFVGGPRDGEREMVATWSLYGPAPDGYRMDVLRIQADAVPIYIHDDLADAGAAKTLAANYQRSTK